MIFDLKNLQDYTVKILDPNDESIVGTGFFFHPDGYILTCYHVIEPILNKQKDSTSSDLFQISLNRRPEKIEASLIHEYSFKDADIAVLKIKENSIESELIRYLPLEIHDERWNSTFEKITCFGYPQGSFIEQGIQASGEISGTANLDNHSVFQVGGFGIKEISPGYSGSPVICFRTKKVIGLINATYKKQENLAFFISLSNIIKHWEKNWIEIIEFHDVYRKIRKEISSESDRLLQEKLQKSPFISLGLQRGDIPKKKKTDHEEDFFRRNNNGKFIHQREWHNFSINNLMPPTGSYLLSSDVGFGKTTFLYWLTCEINKNSDNFAICIICSTFAEWKPESWDDLKGKISNLFKPLFQSITTETMFINDEDIKDCFDFYFYKNK
ncbi:MAG: serine protease, partial [Deltaproteobacteria bacterium]